MPEFVERRMFSSFDALLAEPLSPRDLVAERRAQFVQTNACLALSGMNTDAKSLAIQERIIHGEMTHAQAIALYIERAGKGAS